MKNLIELVHWSDKRECYVPWGDMDGMDFHDIVQQIGKRETRIKELEDELSRMQDDLK